MSNNYVKVSLNATLKEATKCLRDSQQNCVLVVDDDDYLAGILTCGDIRRYVSKNVDMGGSAALDVSNVDACIIIFFFFL